MATLRDIRRRIQSVKKTSQITKAMQMVAAARLRRVQEALQSARPYANSMESVVQSLLAQAEGDAHPLMEQRPGLRHMDLVIVSTDRGLCGGLNTNLFRRVQAFLQENEAGYKAISLDLIGRKSREYFKRRKVTTRKARVNLFPAGPRFDVAKSLSDELVESFLSGEVDEVGVLFNEFRSMLTQRPAYFPLLPLTRKAGGEEAAGAGAAAISNYLYEPGRDVLLRSLLPRYVAVQLYRIMLESQTSEFAARMTAMDNATSNAKDMIDRLTLTYNRARQAAITKELMDIVNGAEALKFQA
ncbi:MAG: ATP synthase F1 subunit gamma [bacterium]